MAELTTKALIIGKRVFQLKKVDTNELFKLRLKETPIFVLKTKEGYYATDIPSNIVLSLEVLLGEHCCDKKKGVCARLFPGPDSEGGCGKVRDFDKDVYKRKGYSIEDAVHDSKRLEKYDFIKCGYETVGTKRDCFVVIECQNYIKQPNRRKKED